MTDASNDPLPARVSEYVIENRDAIPDEVLRKADLDESRRAQSGTIWPSPGTRCSKTTRRTTPTGCGRIPSSGPMLPTGTCERAAQRRSFRMILLLND